jgi:heterotetrameric sarcosine oxidase gamma subunit
VACAPAETPRWRERLAAATADASPTAAILDVSTVFAALTVLGPLARELLAHLTAIDLRPHVTPVGSLRPGAIARQPAVLVREATDRYLWLFGWAVAHYTWTVVADAGRRLGARPVGVDALPALPEALPDGHGHA